MVLLQARVLARQRGQGGAWSDLEKDRATRVENAAHGGGETHRFAQVACPVVGGNRGGCVQPVARGGGDDRQRRRRSRDRFDFCTEALQHRIHHRGMEGMRGLQGTAGDAVGFELLLEPRHRFVAAGDHAGPGRVLGRQGKVGWQALQHCLQWQPHRQHAAGRQRLHHPPAPRDQPQRIRQIEHAGQGRGDEFAHAVADHGDRRDPLAYPETCQGIFDGKNRRLHDRGRQQCVAILAKHHIAQVEAQLAKQAFGAGIECFAEDGLARHTDRVPCRRIASPAPGTGTPRRRLARGGRGRLPMRFPHCATGRWRRRHRRQPAQGGARMPCVRCPASRRHRPGS